MDSTVNQLNDFKDMFNIYLKEEKRRFIETPGKVNKKIEV